jgi:nucleotide-binding universal stress UspA family protein
MTCGGVLAPVVVAVGTGSPDNDAVEWGAAEAAAQGARLRLVHVVPLSLAVDPYGLAPPVNGAPEAGAVAARSVEVALDRARAVAPDVPVSGHLLTGTPSRLLVQQSSGAGLIVLGGRAPGGSRGGPADVLRVRVAARAHCPVVVVRARPQVPAAPSQPRVVVGVDAARSCVAALGFAFHAAAQRGIPLTAVHAWAQDSPADLEGVCGSPAVVEAGAREVLDRVLDRWWHRFPDVPVQLRVVSGDPATALLAAAQGAALVVTGCRGRGPVRSRLLGSVSREVAQHATSPVAVVGGHCAAPTTVAEDRSRAEPPSR